MHGTFDTELLNEESVEGQLLALLHTSLPWGGGRVLEKGRSEAKVRGRLWIGATFLAPPSISLLIYKTGKRIYLIEL